MKVVNYIGTALGITAMDIKDIYVMNFMLSGFLMFTCLFMMFKSDYPGIWMALSFIFLFGAIIFFMYVKLISTMKKKIRSIHKLIGDIAERDEEANEKVESLLNQLGIKTMEDIEND